jgi:hypothetical protein
LRLSTKFATREQEIEDLMKEYDFIGVSERMDESIVVLSMLLKLLLADLIVMSSKQAVGYDDGRSRRGCAKLENKWSTPVVDDYLYGDFLKNNSDYLLYQTVNASLDKTIEALGADWVAAGVQRYHQLSKTNDAACRYHAVFPCPILPGEDARNQTLHSQQDRLFSDAGCGHKCTDES